MVRAQIIQMVFGGGVVADLVEVCVAGSRECLGLKNRLV